MMRLASIASISIRPTLIPPTSIAWLSSALRSTAPLLFGVGLIVGVTLGCTRKYREDLNYDFTVLQTWRVDELPWDIVQFDEVFWDADDTVSMRRLIVDQGAAAQRDCLEIGTGTGLLSLVCLHEDAKSVVATDINPAAVANARYNAAMMTLDEHLEVRQVAPSAPGAFAVIKDTEQFDLIVSNPPWEDGTIGEPLDHAYYDPQFALMDSLLDGLPKHLRPGGRCLLAYGHRPAIERLIEAAESRRLLVEILDDRELDTLPADFLPGMMIEIKCQSTLTPGATP